MRGVHIRVRGGGGARCLGGGWKRVGVGGRAGLLQWKIKNKFMFESSVSCDAKMPFHDLGNELGY